MDVLQDLLSRVVSHNVRMNPDDEKTYLLPMAVAEGSPTHPSYPSGHAINNGGYITALKVTPTVNYCVLALLLPLRGMIKLR